MRAASAPVVLCHSRADRFAAESIVAALRDAGIACASLAPDAVAPGRMARLLAAARIVVVVQSRALGEHAPARRALEIAAAKGLPVEIVRLDDAPPTAVMSRWLHDAPVFDAAEGTLSSRRAQLVARIRHAAGLRLGDADLVDDGTGGIDLWNVERRSVHRGWLVAGAIAAAGLAVLGWRAYERQAADRDFERGVGLLAVGNSRAAAQAFDSAVARRDDWSAAWRQLGFATADPTAQIAAFTRAIELDPADADALAGRARAHAQLRQFPAAATDFGAALARSPATAAWHGERGLVRLLQADEAGAAADLSQCAKLEPSCAETFGARIATVESGLGRPPRDWFAPP